MGLRSCARYSAAMTEASIRDFHASEVVFEQYPQFKTIEPVGSEIVS